MNIDRCVCEGVPFRDLKKVAQREGCRSVKELREHARFATGCRLCVPYVREMLRTGETEFHRILSEEG